jgi:hypothetical protein
MTHPALRPALRALRRPLAVLWLALVAAPVAAEDAYTALSAGAAYHFNFDSGGAIVLRLDEMTADRSVWAIVAGDDAAGAPAAMMVHDAEGRLTAYLDADGAAVETYEPHNCEKVELLCRYKLTDAEGDHTEQRFSELTDEGWTYSVLRLDGGAYEARRLGTVRYDDDGVVFEETWADLATAEEQRVFRAPQ